MARQLPRPNHSVFDESSEDCTEFRGPTGDWDDDCPEPSDAFQRLIQVLVLLRFERQLAESDPDAFSELMDRLVIAMVAAEKERGSEGPRLYAELARRMLRA